MRARTSTMRSKAWSRLSRRWRDMRGRRKHTEQATAPVGASRAPRRADPDASNALGIVLAQYAPVDVLINNAAVCIGRECAVGNVDYGAWTRSFETNVMPARCGSWKRRSRTSPATPSS